MEGSVLSKVEQQLGTDKAKCFASASLIPSHSSCGYPAIGIPTSEGTREDVFSPARTPCPCTALLGVQKETLTCKLPEGNTGLSTSAAPQVGPSHKRRTSLRWSHHCVLYCKDGGKATQNLRQGQEPPPQVPQSEGNLSSPRTSCCKRTGWKSKHSSIWPS